MSSRQNPSGGSPEGTDPVDPDVLWTPEEHASWSAFDAEFARFCAWYDRHGTWWPPSDETESSGPFYPIGPDGEPEIPAGDGENPTVIATIQDAESANAGSGGDHERPRPIPTKAAARFLRVRAARLFSAAKEDLAAGRAIPATETGHGSQRKHLRWDPERIEAWWRERGADGRGHRGE